MIERYSRKIMADKWTQGAKYQSWLEVQLAAIRSWADLGLILKQDRDKILKNASYDEDRIKILEAELKHDVLAFLSSVNESLGEEGRFIHYAMTSSDCVDTGLALQIKDSSILLLKDLDHLLNSLEAKAKKHKYTQIIGRSHGIHAEITSFGLSLALYYDELKRAKTSFELAYKEASCACFSGPVGNFAHAPLLFEERAAKYLDLSVAAISNQIIQRDRHAKLILAISLIASICEQIVVNIRHLQRTELGEVEEFFAKKQKGSSAMPHKKNPILSENITGLCRLLRSYATPALENIALWHERDISHSSVERIIFPDAFILADFMLTRLSSLIEGLIVNENKMKKNIELSAGLIFSAKVLLELPLKGMSRELAYKIAQENAMAVWEKLKKNEGEKDLYLKYLLNDERLKPFISEAELKACFDSSYYMRNVDAIFERVFTSCS